MLLITPDNKSQFKSPIRYSSKFSASILSIILSKVEKRSGDDCGGLYQVDTRKGFERGLEISTQGHPTGNFEKKDLKTTAKRE